MGERMAACLGLLLALGIAGCGGATDAGTTKTSGPPPGPPPLTVYVEGGSGGIATYHVDASTGALTALAGSPFDTACAGLWFAAAPSLKFLYAACDTAVEVLAIDPSTGGLSPIAGSPFSIGVNQPYRLAIDAAGKFLYVGNVGDNTVSVYTLNATTGVPTLVAGAGATLNFNPRMITVFNDFLYVATGNINGGGGDLEAFAINPNTGALTPLAGSPFVSSPTYSVAIHPSGKFLYAGVNNELAGFSLDPNTGALTLLPGPFPQSGGFSLALPTPGHFIYTANVTNGVWGFGVDAVSGGMSFLPGTWPAPTATICSAVSTDSAGKFLAVACLNRIAMFTIDSTTGAITQVPGSPFPSTTQNLAILAIP